MSRAFKTALFQAFPLFVFHMTLGVVVGLLFHDAGYAWYVAPLFAAVVFAGTMQLLALSFLAAGGSLWILVFSLIAIGFRNIFYGLTMLERYEKVPRLLKCYLAHGLIDGIYSILQVGPKFEGKEDVRYITWLTLLAHFSWIFSNLVGSCLGSFIKLPPNLEFALTAFFAAAAVELFLKRRQKRILAIAFVSLALAIILMPGQIMLPGILLAVVGCLIVPEKQKVVA
ncbi:MAG: hypothetical protein S4CHLAM81_04580 [Chlamydiales bacterium]|nr:hypothetical protein [Chlamydiales bacterium]MCH9635247.1 hypothetical protein [Chlamydiales bacterium]MCH9703453.1 AzlC family ABC transporter permease [Chlamydiota bacterium]